MHKYNLPYTITQISLSLLNFTKILLLLLHIILNTSYLCLLSFVIVLEFSLRKTIYLNLILMFYGAFNDHYPCVNCIFNNHYPCVNCIKKIIIPVLIVLKKSLSQVVPCLLLSSYNV